MALLDLNHLKNKYSLQVQKVVHVGAHKGQEVEEYLKNFPNCEIHLFEPQKKLFQLLKSNFSKSQNIYLYDYGLGSVNSVSSMYISSNEGLSSSFLKPKVHLSEHPEISFEQKNIPIKIKVLDELGIERIDFLNIDTQGFELEVLKGSKKVLKKYIKYIILEVNKKELYENGPHIKEIDRFLKQFGFIRTDTHFWLDSYSWGDAFYIKKDLVNKKRVIFSQLKNLLSSINLIYRVMIIARNTLWKISKNF